MWKKTSKGVVYYGGYAVILCIKTIIILISYVKTMYVLGVCPVYQTPTLTAVGIVSGQVILKEKLQKNDGRGRFKKVEGWKGTRG